MLNTTQRAALSRVGLAALAARDAGVSYDVTVHVAGWSWMTPPSARRLAAAQRAAAEEPVAVWEGEGGR